MLYTVGLSDMIPITMNTHVLYFEPIPSTVYYLCIIMFGGDFFLSNTTVQTRWKLRERENDMVGDKGLHKLVMQCVLVGATAS